MRKPNVIHDTNSFTYFFAIYSAVVKWSQVPDFHWQIIKFLENYTNWNERTAVLQVFRSAAKSTITGVWIAWLLSQNPKLRIKIVSDTVSIAEKMVRHTKSVIHQHPLCKQLIDHSLISTSKHFNVKGFVHPRDHSVSCGGVGASMTGSRCDLLIFDDVEASGNCLTEGTRQTLNRTIAEGLNLTDKPNNYVLYIGTPHTYDTIYQREIKKGYSHLTLPLLSNTQGEFPRFTGDSLWPSKFNANEIKKLQKDSSSKGHFLSQYQLVPYNSSVTRFDVSKIHRYDHQITWSTGYPLKAYINDVQLVSVNAYWDPALSQEHTDDSVFAIVFCDKDGHYYIHRTYKLEGDVNQQIDQLVDLSKQFKLPALSIETNGIGAFLPELVIKQCQRYNIGVNSINIQTNKTHRLIEAWEARLSAGMIHISDQVQQGKLIQQLRDFNPVTINKDHNDYIDAAGSAITQSPILIHKYQPVEHIQQFQPSQTIDVPCVYS